MEDLDFIATEEYTKEDVKRVQKRLLEIAKVTTDILERNGIPYIIAFGTLLGAVRHQGFIPWDDDFDFFLFDDSYDDAVACLRRELPEDIIVHDKTNDPLYYKGWAVLKDTKTTTYNKLFPVNNALSYRGIGVDLFKLSRTPRSLSEAYRKQENIAYLVRRRDVGLMEEKEFNDKFCLWTKEFTEAMETVPDEINMQDIVFTGLWNEFPMTEIENVFPLRKYVFGDGEFWGPNNADALLRISYGDYMQIPPLEQRHQHYSSVEFEN